MTILTAELISKTRKSARRFGHVKSEKNRFRTAQRYKTIVVVVPSGGKVPDMFSEYSQPAPQSSSASGTLVVESFDQNAKLHPGHDMEFWKKVAAKAKIPQWWYEEDSGDLFATDNQ